jgi:hypothetical protein
MKIYRYKKDGHLYTLYEQKMPYYNLVAVPYYFKFVKNGEPKMENQK